MVNDLDNHDDESGLSASEYEKLHAAAPAGVGPLYKNGSAVHNTTLPKGEPDEALNVTERNTTTKGTYHMPEDMAASKCASEGGMCSCLGQVHFGLKSSSFLEMHSSGKNVEMLDTRGSVHKGLIECSASNFNVTDSNGGHECYCLRDKAPEPLPEAEHCANDLGLSFCTCWGTIYYGRHMDEANNSLSFSQMLQHGWTSVLSNGDMMCT
jgi:hypothetical protein